MRDRFKSGQWEYLGKHRVRVQKDVVFLRTLGEIDLAEMRTLHEICLDVYRTEGLVFCAVDASGGGSISAEVRRWTAEFNRQNPCEGGNAIYGTSLLVRAAARLALGAASIISRREIPTIFVSDERAAMHWIGEQRHSFQLRQRSAPHRANQMVG